MFASGLYTNWNEKLNIKPSFKLLLSCLQFPKQLAATHVQSAQM